MTPSKQKFEVISNSAIFLPLFVPKQSSTVNCWWGRFTYNKGVYIYLYSHNISAIIFWKLVCCCVTKSNKIWYRIFTTTQGRNLCDVVGEAMERMVMINFFATTTRVSNYDPKRDEYEWSAREKKNIWQVQIKLWWYFNLLKLSKFLFEKEHVIININFGKTEKRLFRHKASNVATIKLNLIHFYLGTFITIPNLLQRLCYYIHPPNRQRSTLSKTQRPISSGGVA